MNRETGRILDDAASEYGPDPADDPAPSDPRDGGDDPTVDATLGRDALRDGHDDQAEQRLRAAAERARGREDLADLRADVHADLATLALRRARGELAASLSLRDDPTLRLRLADVAALLGEHAEAIAERQRVELHWRRLADETASRETHPSAAGAIYEPLPDLAALGEKWRSARPTIDELDVMLRVVSPEAVQTWSYGRVREPETRDGEGRLVPGGPGCPRVFGPERDFACGCGMREGLAHAGEPCPRCGVEVMPSSLRRWRLGHVVLPLPVIDPRWRSSRLLPVLLDVRPSDLARVFAREAHLVIDPRYTPFGRHEILDAKQLADALDLYGELEHSTGAEGLALCLESIDVHALRAELDDTLRHTTSLRRHERAERRLAVVTAFCELGWRAEHIALRALPVLPPGYTDGAARAKAEAAWRAVLLASREAERMASPGLSDAMLAMLSAMLHDAVDGLFEALRPAPVKS